MYNNYFFNIVSLELCIHVIYIYQKKLSGFFLVLLFKHSFIYAKIAITFILSKMHLKIQYK